MSNNDVPAISRAPTRNARSARTRNEVRSAFLRLIAHAPFGTVTVREIAAEASIGYATFFRHYADKDALLHDVAAKEISRLLALTLPILTSVDSDAASRALCAYVWEHRILWKVLLTGGAASPLKKAFIEQARALADAAKMPESEIPTDLRVVFSVSGTLEILGWWLEHGSSISIDRIARIHDELATRPHLSNVDARLLSADELLRHDPKRPA